MNVVMGESSQNPVCDNACIVDEPIAMLAWSRVCALFYQTHLSQIEGNDCSDPFSESDQYRWKSAQQVQRIHIVIW